MTYDVPRRFERTEFRHLPWTFSLKWEAPLPGDRPVRVEARNLGAGGMKFVSNQRIPIFASLEISFFGQTDGKELLRLTGKVIRVEEVDTGQGEKTYGVAVEFSETGALQALLEKLPPVQSAAE